MFLWKNHSLWPPQALEEPQTNVQIFLASVRGQSKTNRGGKEVWSVTQQGLSHFLATSNQLLILYSITFRGAAFASLKPEWFFIYKSRLPKHLRIFNSTIKGTTGKRDGSNSLEV